MDDKVYKLREDIMEITAKAFIRAGIEKIDKDLRNGYLFGPDFCIKDCYRKLMDDALDLMVRKEDYAKNNKGDCSEPCVGCTCGDKEEPAELSDLEKLIATETVFCDGCGTVIKNKEEMVCFEHELYKAMSGKPLGIGSLSVTECSACAATGGKVERSDVKMGDAVNTLKDDIARAVVVFIDSTGHSPILSVETEIIKSHGSKDSAHIVTNVNGLI